MQCLQLQVGIQYIYHVRERIRDYLFGTLSAYVRNLSSASIEEPATKQTYPSSLSLFWHMKPPSLQINKASPPELLAGCLRSAGSPHLLKEISFSEVIASTEFIATREICMKVFYFLVSPNFFHQLEPQNGRPS